ncbi:MAG: branched-chain amino acid ABC transporter permease [Haloquadratum sp.]
MSDRDVTPPVEGDAGPRELLARAFRPDAVKVTALFAGIWVLFWFLSVQLGYPINGIVSTIRRVTFLSAVYALAVLALNLHWGYAGLFNIGVAGFLAIGAYTTAILSGPTGGTPSGLGLPLPIGIVGGVLAATVVGLLAALPALRLKADYLAIVTVALSEIIRLAFNSRAFSGVTGGASGFDSLPTNPVRSLLLSEPGSIISTPTALGRFVFGLAESLGLSRLVAINVVYTVGTLVVVFFVYHLLERTAKSPFGRVLKAIRDDDVATRSLGKDTRDFKIRAFALGCGLMGLAGVLWFVTGPRSTVTPSNFRPQLTFYIFIALIIGGAGSNTGSILGAAVFASLLFEAPPLVSTLATQTLQVSAQPANLIEALVPLASGNLAPLLGFLLSNIDTLRFIGIGVLLVALVQRRPDGLLGARKETAAAVDLSAASRPADRGGSDE